MRTLRVAQLFALLLCSLITRAQQTQQISSLDRDRARAMLENISNDVRKHYYDPKFHGLDWDFKVKETREKIDKAPCSAPTK